MTGADGAMIAHQSVGQLGGRASILVKQRADHTRLDRLMDGARANRAAGGREHAVALRTSCSHACRSCCRAGSCGRWVGGGRSCDESRRPDRTPLV